jgi:energy-coupling factor transport system ATP-binding protein
MIKFSNFSFYYPDNPFPVLNEINLEIPPGSLSLITGASGSGKSTLLRCINGLVPHFSGGKVQGEVNVFGSNPITLGTGEMADNVGFVFQDPESQFIFDVVEDEIVFLLENQSLPHELMQRRMDEICHQLGLEKIRNNKIQALSGGEKQLIAIASVLVGLPKVLILDEPTSQLDQATAARVMKIVLQLKQKYGLTVLVAEQRLERILPFADQIIHLQGKGRVQAGKPEIVIQEMSLVPPIIQIARKLDMDPLPIYEKDFPGGAFTQEPKLIGEPFHHMHKTPVMQLDNLTVSSGNHSILTDVDLKLYQGEILTLLGSTGSGKTTLIRSALSLIESSGEIMIFGKSHNETKRDRIIRQMAYLPQNPNDLLFAESVLDELITTLRNHNKTYKREELIEFLSLFNLDEKLNTYPRDLSVGEKQRTALSAITVHDPQVILLDEPTRGLDYANKALLADLLSAWKNEGKAILIATHDIEFAAIIADVVAIIENGRITFCGLPEIAFTEFPAYQTQTARLFPSTQWIVPEDIPG